MKHSESLPDNECNIYKEKKSQRQRLSPNDLFELLNPAMPEANSVS